MKKFDETLTLAGAERLAKAITRYWRERGFAVNCTIRQEATPDGRHFGCCAVRSDMIGGLPRDYHRSLEEARPNDISKTSPCMVGERYAQADL